MRCARCDTENAPNHRFCGGCGAALSRGCPKCGQDNLPAARFCGHCGTSLEPAGSPPPVARVAAEGELKQITILFADVAGSTSAIEELNPEDAGRRLAPAIEAMKAAVRRFEGSVVRVQGDGIMALFGAPQPQEDHAVRACCAALAMQATVRDLGDAGLPVRVGIHTGEVLARTVSTDFSTDFDVTGVVVHIANRLEGLAPDGGIAISGATLRNARQFVRAESLGRHTARGLSTPLAVFLLTGLQHGPTSVRFASEPDRSDFVGREIEMTLLERALERAAEGEGCVVGLVAEAGVGKSRLCFEFAEVCRAKGVRVIEGRAVAHSRATPFLPAIELLKGYFEFAPEDSDERARQRIDERMRAMDPAFEADLPLLFDFLGIAAPDAARLPTDAMARRERLKELFRKLVRTAGSKTRAVFLIEDLHWMDSGSESLMEVLVDALPGTRILLLVNYRPGYVPPWAGKQFDQIALAPLRATLADQLASRLLGDDETVAPLLPLIADRARGNPLFIEELVRKFEEGGNLTGEHGAYRLVRAPDPRLVPDTVQAIIAARIDARPEPEKAVLQTAAVIGREFEVPLLARLLGPVDATLPDIMHRLSQAGLVHEQTGSAAVFAFRHPMVHDVAYRSLLSERRRALHGAVAADLEKSAPDPAQVGFLAYHWEEAGNLVQAASGNMKAATWHGTRDPAQALEAWKRARRLLSALPLEGQARQSLAMASGQIVNFAWRVGLSAAEVQPYYAESLAITHDLGNMRGAMLVTAAYGRSLAASGSAAEYVATVTDLLEKLDETRNASLKPVLTAILCQALRHAGDLPRALAANDEAMASLHLIDESIQQTLGFNVGVWVRGMRAQILAMMARPDEARPLLDALIAADETAVDVLHRLLAHATHIDIAWGDGDDAAASHHSEAVTVLAEKSGNPYLLVYGRSYAGIAQSLRGEHEAAARTLTEALAYARRRHAGLENEARLLADLAHALMRAGQLERAAAVADEAAAVARRRGAKVWLTYAEWLKGGPHSPAFVELVETTGAALFKGLSHPSMVVGGRGDVGTA
jgi:class 3 adenylate cyclase/tetratricopeptide (TPR) repeat protein